MARFFGSGLSTYSFSMTKGITLAKSAKILGCATTKFQYDQWESSLRRHPDREKVEGFLRGIKYGEPIGFKGDESKTVWVPEHKLKPQHEQAVEENIQKLKEQGKIIGPFEGPTFPGSRISPLTVVEKVES